MDVVGVMAAYFPVVRVRMYVGAILNILNIL